EYETERAVIGSALEDPLCPGDLEFIDDHIAFAEDMLGVEADLPIEIYLFATVEVPCDAGYGCYFPKEDRIVTAWTAVDHEIVHAVAKSLTFESKFWVEGVAIALSDEGTHRTAEITASALDSDNEKSSGHFVRWLIETRGIELLRRVLDGEPAEEVYAASKSALVSEYEEDAPYAYPWWDVCPFPEIPEVEDGEWFEELTFSCESPDARQTEPVEGVAVVRTLALSEGTYSLRV